MEEEAGGERGLIPGPRQEEGGVRFGLWSKHATSVDLVICDGDGSKRREIPLEGPRDHVWSAFVEGAGAGTLYGFRVDGPWDPAAGHLFNRNLLLIDPYARALTGKHGGRVEDHLGYDASSPPEARRPSARSNLDLAPRCIVVDGRFDWEDDAPPGHPIEELVIYELHARGYTIHASSRVGTPGTFLGIVEKIPYLERMGVSAVEFLPIAESFTEKRLRDLGLVNYWGYNPIALFAPDVRFASSAAPGCVVNEFKTMVRELHRASIEVILDVVFNHTGEQDHLGPTLSLRGIDNATYYMLRPEDPRRYVNWTGCGNTLDFTEPAVIRLAVDCLRYWVREMHVDGFRFDLAPILGRGSEGAFDPAASFFAAVARDPVLGGVKLIAEPWDLAPRDPVVTGAFPPGWSEWNGTYRDTLRQFMKGDGGVAWQMATCIEGSRHVFRRPCQSPTSSVNFLTCHDGFTLADLVSFASKRNEANGEGGRDGEDNNNSWNSGAEGPTDDPEVLALRQRRVRNLLGVLLLSRGVPMILAGDEFLRTQGGNNNAYCQDNEISWIDWALLEKNEDFQRFVRLLIALRRAHPALRGEASITWHGSTGDPVDAEGDLVWDDLEVRSLAFGLSSPSDDEFLVMLNAHWEVRAFRLPDPPTGTTWLRVIDTDRTGGREIAEPGSEDPLPRGQDEYRVEPRSLVVLRSARR